MNGVTSTAGCLGIARAAPSMIESQTSGELALTG
jgi:hypothetical protein